MHNRQKEIIKLLCFSRHPLTKEQRQGLIDIYGYVNITQINFNATSWKDVADAAKDYDIIAAVLPKSILIDLIDPKHNTKPVIVSKYKYVKTSEQYFDFRTGCYRQKVVKVFDSWYQVTGCKFDQKRLNI